jgi:hypothetical protein
MDLEKYLFIMDVTNLDDLYMFYMEQTEEIKNILHSIVFNSSILGTNIPAMSEPETKKNIAKHVKNIETLIFNYNTICGQAKGMLERINQLKKMNTLPVSI